MFLYIIVWYIKFVSKIIIKKEIKTMKKFLISVVFSISVLSFGQINGYADENGFEINETNIQ